MTNFFVFGLTVSGGLFVLATLTLLDACLSRQISKSSIALRVLLLVLIAAAIYGLSIYPANKLVCA